MNLLTATRVAHHAIAIIAAPPEDHARALDPVVARDDDVSGIVTELVFSFTQIKLTVRLKPGVDYLRNQPILLTLRLSQK